MFWVAAQNTWRRWMIAHNLPLGHQCPIPRPAVLLVEGDQLLVPDAGLAPGVGEQQQPEQAGHLRLLGKQVVQDPGEPDGLAGQVGADGVALGGGEVTVATEC